MLGGRLFICESHFQLRVFFLSYSPEMLSVVTEPLPYPGEVALATNVALCPALEKETLVYL